MTAILVHGNPETPAIWNELTSALHTEVLTPGLPGFGCARPSPWAASMDDYADWLVEQIEAEHAVSGPVDLVGHDWGGILVPRAATLRPDLVRSWVSDALGALHERHHWHDLAQIWRTEGAGEEFFERQREHSVAEVASAYEGSGMPASVASTLAEAVDEEFARCVLALYRSAGNPELRAWGEAAEEATLPPGMLLHATADPFSGKGVVAGEMAQRLGASTGTLEGQGHWWMLGAPSAAAELLQDFWRSAGVPRS